MDSAVPVTGRAETRALHYVTHHHPVVSGRLDCLVIYVGSLNLSPHLDAQLNTSLHPSVQQQQTFTE